MKNILAKLSRLQHLSAEEMEYAVEIMMKESEAPDAVVGAFLMALSVRLPTPEELCGAARALRRHMVGVDPKLLAGMELLDTCGTGGSGQSKMNISTATAFICAGAGQPVAKHGNRSASGRCGSADVLEALGIRLDLPPKEIAALIHETNFGFLFAPQHHPATKRVGGVRRALGIRTIFNFLGPLANPFGAVFQLVGVSDRRMVSVMAEALQGLGAKRALVVCAEDGLDEVSLMTATFAVNAQNGELKELSITPELLDFERPATSPEPVHNAQEAASSMLTVLCGESSEHRDWVLANAGVALCVSGKAESFESGVNLARETIASGSALRALETVKKLSNS